ncbi:pyridoxamine 5'-phosphate oxidase family protein [Paraflavisolibacter sp. H34]|uniref:pyridoxamine 5'-phosphate oxidase family protein n=1 Tax=Huijunlia imazamoxiresistens TaxID=3127457 RepID=UPI0030197448
MDTTEKKLHEQEAIEKFQDLVSKVTICMFTTLDDFGKVMSRPMWTVNVDDEGNAWFFTNEFSEKIQEVSKDNLVNLIYAHPAKNIYVNVRGTCTVILDKSRMESLWKPSMKEWFPNGLEDPKICLVKVNTEEAFYWNTHSSKMALFFQMVKSLGKGGKYKEDETGKLDLHQP